MTLLVTQSDYNIAYLYFLRGEYSRAIEMLRDTREEVREERRRARAGAVLSGRLRNISGIESEQRGQEAAHEGYLRFQKLGMGYEEAKCLAFEAMASSQLGKALSSLELFAQARAEFVSDKNLVWPWLMDLYQAVVLYNEGRLFEARRLCAGAAQLRQLLPAQQGRPSATCYWPGFRCAPGARDRAGGVHWRDERLARLEAPVLHYQAHFLMGQIQQASGDFAGAYDSCQKARA